MRKITVELDEAIVEMLEEVANDSGLTLADIIAEAASDYLLVAGYVIPD